LAEYAAESVMADFAATGVMSGEAPAQALAEAGEYRSAWTVQRLGEIAKGAQKVGAAVVTGIYMWDNGDWLGRRREEGDEEDSLSDDSYDPGTGAENGVAWFYEIPDGMAVACKYLHHSYDNGHDTQLSAAMSLSTMREFWSGKGASMETIDSAFEKCLEHTDTLPDLPHDFLVALGLFGEATTSEPLVELVNAVAGLDAELDADEIQAAVDEYTRTLDFDAQGHENGYNAFGESSTTRRRRVGAEELVAPSL